mmetsp:Transcript_4762/g.10664  ORF Transcript_4762/g.10664 Transcript_4762/m.10664 type:complete len:121 (+) Transcript_4762:198-560(+)
MKTTFFLFTFLLALTSLACIDARDRLTRGTLRGAPESVDENGDGSFTLNRALTSKSKSGSKKSKSKSGSKKSKSKSGSKKSKRAVIFGAEARAQALEEATATGNGGWSPRTRVENLEGGM